MNPLATPRRTSPLVAVFGIADPNRLRTALPVLVVALGSGRFVAVVLAALVVGVAIGVLGWYRRLWWYDGEVLHLDEGVVVRNQRRIPVDRIQHVELERRLRHQVFGLAAVRVETAGGSGAELRLDAVRRAEAEELRRSVRAATAGRTAPDELPRDEDGRPLPGGDPVPAEVLVRLPPARLLLAGVTGPEVLAVFTALAIGLDALIDLGVDPERLDSVQVGDAVIVLLALLAVPAWFLTAGCIALVRKWDLTAVVRGSELHVTYGLLRRQEFVLSTERVQDARVAQRLLLRPFGRSDLRVRSAASGAGESSRIDVPLLADDEIDRVLARILPEAVPRPRLRPAPPAARRRSMVRGFLLGAAVGAVVAAAALVGSSPAPGVAALLGPPLGVLVGVASYRGLGWAERDGVHHSRTGAFARHTAVVPVARVQSAAVVSSWFQRRRGLASVRLDLAAGRVQVVDRDLGEARAIAAHVTLPGRDDGRPRRTAREVGAEAAPPSAAAD